MVIKIFEGKVRIEHETGDGAGWIIECIEDLDTPIFELYEIPRHGGEPIFDRGLPTLISALELAALYT